MPALASLRSIRWVLLAAALALPCFAAPPSVPVAHEIAATQSQSLHDAPRAPAVQSAPGEQVPSDDPAIWDFHSLGLVEGHTNIFRSASPLRDFVKKKGLTPDDPAIIAEADIRMKRLHDLGIRTIISFENPDPKTADPESSGKKSTSPWITAEKDAATRAGIAFVSRPLANSGPDSFETMSDDAVIKQLDPIVKDIFKFADQGGVLFHCAAGHDRTGITTAYIRVKYQHWPVDQAIAEMRRFGHNWPKYSSNDGITSWTEEHVWSFASPATTAPSPSELNKQLGK